MADQPGRLSPALSPRQLALHYQSISIFSSLISIRRSTSLIEGDRKVHAVHIYHPGADHRGLQSRGGIVHLDRCFANRGPRASRLDPPCRFTAVMRAFDPMRDIGCQFCCDAPCPHSSVFETQHARKNCGDCTTPDARLADQVDRPSWLQQISSSDVALLRRSLQRRDSHSCHLCYTAARSSSASAGRHGQAPEVCD
jgi:hypothetical protein